MSMHCFATVYTVEQITGIPFFFLLVEKIHSSYM
jgi:hypothetical protein